MRDFRPGRDFEGAIGGGPAVAGDVEQHATLYAEALPYFAKAYELEPESRAAVYGYVNALLLVGVSLLARPIARDREQARSFVLGAEPEQLEQQAPAGRRGQPFAVEGDKTLLRHRGNFAGVGTRAPALFIRAKIDAFGQTQIHQQVFARCFVV